MESGLAIREDKFFLRGAQKKAGFLLINFEWWGEAPVFSITK